MTFCKHIDAQNRNWSAHFCSGKNPALRQICTVLRVNSLRTKGFSLVEVVLALGIVAFAVVATIGVLPVGLQSMRASRDDSAKRVIYSGIRSELASLDSTQAVNLSGTRFFDHEGEKVNAASESRFECALQTRTPTYPGVGFDDGVSVSRIGHLIALKLYSIDSTGKSDFALILPDNGR